MAHYFAHVAYGFDDIPEPPPLVRIIAALADTQRF
jgi:hypothetical protein